MYFCIKYIARKRSDTGKIIMLFFFIEELFISVSTVTELHYIPVHLSTF